MPKYQDLVAQPGWLLVMTGRAWVFGDHITQQQVLADAHLEQPAEVAKAFAMNAIDGSFAQRVTPGDFIVAGVEFAAHATHRAVPAALKALGIAAVIARSFGRFFLRNAIHVGLPALTVEETGAIKNGDRLRVDIETHVVANQSSGDRYVIRNIDEETLLTLRAGGTIERLRR